MNCVRLPAGQGKQQTLVHHSDRFEPDVPSLFAGQRNNFVGLRFCYCVRCRKEDRASTRRSL